MIEREDYARGIEDALSTHSLEIVERHRSRAVRAQRAIDLAHNDITGRRISSGLFGEDFFAGGLTGRQSALGYLSLTRSGGAGGEDRRRRSSGACRLQFQFGMGGKVVQSLAE